MREEGACSKKEEYKRGKHFFSFFSFSFSFSLININCLIVSLTFFLASPS